MGGARGAASGRRWIEIAGARDDVPVRLLAGLGLFSVLDAQADPGLLARWHRGRLHLRVHLDAAGLERFLLRAYAPSPVLSPWNRGSGFHGGDGGRALEAFERGAALRFERLRTGIAEARYLAQVHEGSKTALLCALQERWAGADWTRAACPLDPEGVPAFRTFLGSGGNDGRFDLSKVFLQHLGRLFEAEGARGAARPGSLSRLRAALWSSARPGATDAVPVGHLHPAAAGGANAGPGAIGRPRANPWHVILALEGVVFLARAEAGLGLSARGDPGAGAAPESLRLGLEVATWAEPSTTREAVRRLRGPRPARLARFTVTRRNGGALISIPTRASPAGSVADPLRLHRSAGPEARELPPSPLRTAIHALDVSLAELAGRAEPPEARRVLAAAADVERGLAWFPQLAAKSGLLPLPALPRALWRLAETDAPALRVVGALVDGEDPASGTPLRGHILPLRGASLIAAADRDPSTESADPRAPASAGLARGRDAYLVAPGVVRGPEAGFRRLLALRLRRLGGRRGTRRAARTERAVEHTLRGRLAAEAWRFLPAALALERDSEPAPRPEGLPPWPAWFAQLDAAVSDHRRRRLVLLHLESDDPSRALRACGAVPPLDLPGAEELSLALLLAGDA